MDMNERVCGCFNITVKDIVDAKESGCKSVKDIVRKTQAGTACKRCQAKVELTSLKVLLNRLYIK